jgi:hypothetical protein
LTRAGGLYSCLETDFFSVNVAEDFVVVLTVASAVLRLVLDSASGEEGC